MSDNHIIYSSNHTHALHHTFFEPTDKVQATLLVLHGMCEHSGRYVEFAKFLATQGIAVATYDYLGHGQTAKSADELGYFAEKNPMQTLLQDTIIMADALKSRHPDVPHFIMGHSMGSFIVRNVLKHHSHRFNGAVLMATSDKDYTAKVLLPVFRLLNKFFSKKSSQFGSNLTQRILLSRLNIKYSQDSKNLWLSENKENIERFKADHLCGFDFTNNGYMALAGLMDGALNQPWYRSIQSKYPLLIISGQDDPLGNMGQGIDSLVGDLQAKGMTNITKKLYQNMRHEPLHETDNQKVYEDIQQWLLAINPS